MRILHVIEGIQESCGVSRFVVEIVREMKRLGEDVAIVTTRNWNVSADDIRILQTLNPEKEAKLFQPEIVHIHGCWNLYIHRMASWCRRAKVLYYISPHGAWTVWAMSFHKWKKTLAWWLYQKKDCKYASGIHVTVESEAYDARRLINNLPITVAPLGIRFSKEINSNISFSMRKYNILYLGRLHPVKNIERLLKAWKSIDKHVRQGWNLIIAGKPGPDNPDYLEVLKAQSDTDCHYVGEIIGEDKDALYRNSRLFILPSFSENFGIVILEALAAGTPVIASIRTPWRSIVENACGWQCEPTIESIKKTLTDAMSCSDTKLEEMGQRGVHFVQEHYSWEHSAKLLLDGYKKILNERQCQ